MSDSNNDMPWSWDITQEDIECDQVRAMNEAMAQPLGELMDDDELEAELAELEKMEAEELLNAESLPPPNKSKSIPVIQKRRRYIVAGYVRQMELHQDIANVIALFYGNASDEWDPIAIKFNTKVNVIGNTIEVIDSVCSVFLKNRVSEGIHCWSFKFDVESSYSTIPQIGIWKTKHPQIVYVHDMLGSVGYNKCYVYSVKAGCLMDPNKKGVMLKKYPMDYKEGGIIQMILNLNNLTLSYKTNGISYGKAFDIDDTEYVAAVTLRRSDKVTLLDYEQYLYDED